MKITGTSKLSQRTMQALVREVRRRFGLTLRWVTPEGRMAEARAGRVERLPELDRMLTLALEESVHWGEPYSFFLVPGLLAWMVPGMDGEQLVAGLTGAVLSDGDPDTQRDVAEELVARGAKRGEAIAYVRRLPVWPKERIQAAVVHSEEALYRLTGWKPTRLTDNRARAAQQRQIAEEIHRRKTAQGVGHPVDEERRLLALIRAGDRKGARGSLNSLLGDMFLTSPNPVVIKARAIELLGYLVRAAVENSPHLEPLIEKNHRWTTALINTREFEDLTHVLGQALDDFMDNVYLLGTSRGNAAVRNALAYMADHFREALTLAQVARAAGLSVHRTAHVLKEATGRSFLQHVHRLRIDAAKRLLESGGRSSTEVAYAVGYNDQSYFIRHFKRQNGVTPGRFVRGR